jgi:hypothetical protein
MNEYNFFSGSEYDVGLAGKVFSAQAKAIAHLVKQSAHHQFRPRIAVPDAAHVLRALVFR